MSRKSQVKRRVKRQKRMAQKRNHASIENGVQIEGTLHDTEEIGVWLYHEAVRSKPHGLSLAAHLNLLREMILSRWPGASEQEVLELIRRGRYAASRIFAAGRVVLVG